MRASSIFFPASVAIPRHANAPSGQLCIAMGEPANQEGAEGYKALLVDDNPDLLDMASAMFTNLGFEVITASSGSEAADILRRTPDIGVLFTDVVMPGMSGIQLGYEARKLIPNIKVILVSGYPNPAAKAGHGSLHDFDFLPKPYRFSQIVRLLARPN